MRKSSFLAIVAAVLFASCTVGPNYRRPAVQVPRSFRAPDPMPTDPASLADLKWFEVYKDE
jgi:multidrug efflux system outer membrane protein